MKKVVLLSGGLDSVVSFKRAHDEGGVELGITFDYGQVAFANEVRSASRCAERYGVRHRVISLPWYRDVVSGPLVGAGELSVHPEGLASGREGLLREAWIPNRNCVFLSVGAAYAEALGAEAVVVGLNREEAEVFPDNSGDFVEAFNRVLETSTLSRVRVVAYTAAMTKQEIVRLGLAIEAPLDLVYSCYARSDDDRMCGLCQSCARLKAALAASGVSDRFRGRFKA